MNKYQPNSKFLPFTVLVFLVTIPMFLSGYFTKNVIGSLVMIAILLGLFLMNKEKVMIANSWPNRILGVIFILSVIMLPFSLLVIHSIPGVMWWFAFFIVFIYSQWLVTNESSLIKLSKAFTITATVFALHATYYFIVIGITSYPRMNSIFDLHNVYGGFLLLPVLISIYFALSSEIKWEKYSWITISALLFSNVILTFSRGSLVSNILGIIISVILFHKQIWSSISKIPKNAVLMGVFIVILTVVVGAIMAKGFWVSAKYMTIANLVSTTSTSTEIFANENSDNNAFVARLAYWNDSFDLFKTRPLTGVGPGNYEDGLTQTKTDPAFFAADPHNFFLKLLAEQGIFITLLFVVFLVLVFYKISKLLKMVNYWSPLKLAIFTGLVSSLIHIGMEIDWRTPALPIIFMAFTGALVGCQSKENETIKKYRSNSIVQSALILSILFSGISLVIYLADNSWQAGNNYFENQKYQLAISEYSSAISKNPYEPKYWYSRSKTYFAINDYKSAKNNIDIAINIYPTFGEYYSARAILSSNLNDKSKLEQDLLKSIKLHPASDLTSEVLLSSLYMSQKRYDQVIALANKMEEKYLPYQKSLWFTLDSNSKIISSNIELIQSFKKLTEEKLTTK